MILKFPKNCLKICFIELQEKPKSCFQLGSTDTSFVPVLFPPCNVIMFQKLFIWHLYLQYPYPCPSVVNFFCIFFVQCTWRHGRVAPIPLHETCTCIHVHASEVTRLSGQHKLLGLVNYFCFGLVNRERGASVVNFICIFLFSVHGVMALSRTEGAGVKYVLQQRQSIIYYLKLSIIIIKWKSRLTSSLFLGLHFVKLPSYLCPALHDIDESSIT